MNRPLLTLLALVLPGALAGAPPVRPAGPTVPVDLTRFNEFTSTYKEPAQVPPNFFNPFKIQAMTDAHSRHDVLAVNNDAIVAALTLKGLSGFVCNSGAEPGRAILGDEVFSTGDEITFATAKTGEAPVVPGASVVLKEVTADHLVFEVTPSGEGPRDVNLAVRQFWH